MIFIAYRKEHYEPTYFNFNKCVTCNSLVEDEWPTQRCGFCLGTPADFEEMVENGDRADQEALDWLERYHKVKYLLKVNAMNQENLDKRIEWVRKMEQMIIGAKRRREDGVEDDNESPLKKRKLD